MIDLATLTDRVVFESGAVIDKFIVVAEYIKILTCDQHVVFVCV